MSTSSQSRELVEVSLRPMQEDDLSEARRIVHLAFGTQFGVPDPSNFWPDKEYVRTRWRTDPGAALVATADGTVIGSNFAANWGSFGFFGPLTVRPDLWNQRVAQQLLAPTMDLFERWGVREACAFTFPNSPKHVSLYQRFGFWPRHLTAVMSKIPAPWRGASWTSYSALDRADRQHALDAAHELTDLIYDGLDVTIELRSVSDQNLGETLMLWGGDALDAFAVCHCGEGTEAGKDVCYVKFAAVRPGPSAPNVFEHLLDACEAFTSARSLQRLQAGVNTARRQAYHYMLGRGFRADALGVAMHRPDAPSYNRPDVFVLDDWR